MAWNEPGNGGNKDRDPWGSGGDGRNQGPPDLDKALRNFMERLNGLLGGGKKPGSGGNAPGLGAMGLAVIGVLLLVVWAISGTYTVRESDRGVVLRFGEFHNIVEPGLNWRPRFIDEVIPVDVRSVRSLPATGFMLTKDENVVHVQMDVQYRVVDPRAYLFSVTNADNSLSQATDSALRYVVGHTTMDDILTTGRELVRQQTYEELEKIIDRYQMGLLVVDVNFLPARPPEEVKEAFDDVIAAREDEERYKREAEAYEREIVPRARGKAIRMEQDAIAYKERVEQEAEGQVARFALLLPEYNLAPEVTRQRLYIESMEQVLSNTSKVMVDVEGSGNLMYLPLDKIGSGFSNQQTQQQSSPARSNVSSSSASRNSAVSQSSAPTADPLRSSTRQGRN